MFRCNVVQRGYMWICSDHWRIGSFFLSFFSYSKGPSRVGAYARIIYLFLRVAAARVYVARSYFRPLRA